MVERIMRYGIFFILAIGIIGAGNLVFEEFKTGEGCPKIMHIPICLVILICFIIPFIVHLLKKWNILYFLFTGLACGIALVASVLQFTGNAECPKTASDTPMCYYSLVLFSSLILMKKFEKNFSENSRKT